LFFLIPFSYCIYLIILIRIINQGNESEIKSLKIFKDNQWELFNLVNQVKENLSYPLNLSKILNPFTTSCNKLLKANGTGILLFDENENFLHLISSYGDFPELSVDPIVKGETILGKAGIENKSIIYDQDYIKQNGQECFINYEKINSIIIEPVILLNRIIGLIIAVRTKGRGNFSQKRFNNIKFFSQYLSILLNNIYKWIGIINKTEIQKEIDLSYFIHQKLILKIKPEIKQLSYSIYNQALKGTNGDYIDVIPLSDSLNAFIIADVAGKGIGSAAVLLIISSLIKLIVNYENNPGKILSVINSILANTANLEQYSTMSILIYDNKNQCIYYSNAGHIPLTILRKPYNKTHSIDIEGLPLGIENNINYKSKKINVLKDDLILLYTDGLVEAMNHEGKQYGVEQLIQFMKNNISLTTEQIINKLRNELKTFSEGSKLKDDQTLLLLKCL
jgi:sigma-B regulation protein RsbU (phosphoserine phosphatase)